MKRRHPALDSAEVRAKRALLRQQNARFTARLQFILPSKWPPGYGSSDKTETLAVYQSNKFLVQIVEEADKAHLRLSVNRTELNAAGDGWQDGITWDELMEIKAQCGHAEDWAVEVFPPSHHLVNVANMRHLWLLPEAPPYAWTKKP